MTGAAGAADLGLEPPGPDDPVRLVAWQLAVQAASCAAMGSPLSAQLLTSAAADALAGGVCGQVLLADVRPGRGDAAALRFLAALHRLVLTRAAPRLALHYPTVGGTPDLVTVGGDMRRTVADHAHVLPGLVARPCQTNEVGRTAGLLVGLLEVARVTGLPLRLLEVGASAGLNLRLDRFGFDVPSGGGTRRLGPHDAEVVLADRWTAPLPHDPRRLPEVVARRGCDLRPVDPTTPEGRLDLSASVWADQTQRFARLAAALRTAAELPVQVDAAAAPAWVAARLREPAPGAVSVVVHSIVEEYLAEDERAALHAAVEGAGARASSDAPVAHVRLEPLHALRVHGVSARVWPQHPEPVALARCGAHGQDVTPLATLS